MPPFSQNQREHAERNLGALVIAIEFTLISVMVGVVLVPLLEHAHDLLRDLRFEYWLYILSGILLTLYLWTEVITHSLSIIGWPIEFGHNLLYILFAFAFALQMNFLDDPRGWFTMSLVNSILGATLLWYDWRVIARRRATATGSAALVLDLALKRQRGLLRVTPLTTLNGIVSIALVVSFPGFFIEQHGHLILVVIQIGAFLALLMRTIRTFGSWTEAIVQRTIEELASEGKK